MKSPAHMLLERGLWLCMYGEDAPGMHDTWLSWGHDVEVYLRSQPNDW